MHLRVVVASGLLGIVLAASLGAQEAATSPRLAAIQFVRDSNPIGPDHPGRTFVVESSRNAFGRHVSESDSSNARELAKTLRAGEDARRGADVLSCVRNCRALPERRLITVVNAPRTARGVTSVLVETYSREKAGGVEVTSYERLRLEVAQRESGWVVVRKLEHVAVQGR